MLETVLKFGYPYEMRDKVDELEKILMQKGIRFILYRSDGYWHHEFIVRKTKGFTWNDIMKIVNSVKAPKYKKDKESFINDVLIG